MKIKSLATLAFIGTTFIGTVLAQDEKITTSKEFQYECGTPYPVVDAAIKSYASKDGNVVSFKMSKGKVTLQKFSGQKLGQEDITVYEDFPKGTVYEDDLETEDFVYLLFSVWDKANKTEQLYVRAINLTTAKFENEGERVIAVDGKVTGGDGNKFKLATSFDNSKLLIYFRKKPESRNDKINKDVIGLYVFDTSLKQIWGKDAEMPYTEARMNNIDYTVDGNGNVFILTEVMKEGETKRYDRDNNPNFDYQLVSISESGVDVNASTIDVKGKYVTQVGFFEGKDNTLLLAGFYGNKRGYQVDGIFYSSINKEGDQTDFKSFEIPVELIKQFTSQRNQDKMDRQEEKGKDLGITNMVLRELYIEADGSILFASEKHYVVSTYNAKTGQYTYTHYYEEMLAAKIDKNGDLVYMKKLPKKQVSPTTYSPWYRGGLGYRLVDSKNNYYFMFLDNVKNLELAENKVPERHIDGKGGFLTAYQVNKETGAVRKLSILDTRDAQGYDLFQFNTERIVALDDDEFALECYIKSKQDIMIRIKILE
ncbi:hypothetical protein [Fluviicola sp.]|jgi:hypothetical protein|uniref:hypothetical protein n=1 Tax=Fluviicola sp. TaxID=1917219 RepID=UPI002832E6BA|nr:hypothetical protein [Fluviicola sp.]MDR0802163.1 hypothetical protein [Fluviicola sp.]